MSKLRGDYLEILNLDEQASPEAIEARFNELYSDFQIRLTNAPTPNLKKLYQKNLQELEEAYEALNAKSISKGPATDLPSAKPVQNTNPSLTASNSNERPIPTTRFAPREQAGNPLDKTKNQKSGIPITTFIISLVIALAGIALLVTLYLDGKKEVAEIKIEAQKNEEFLKLKDVLKNGKFKVENRSKSDLTLVITHITFLNNKGELQEYKFLGTSGNPKPVVVRLSPGKNTSINQYDGPIKWDGSVVSYAMLVYKDNSPQLNSVYSGIWLHEWPENKLVITD